jgi:hypothetical protein
MTYTVVHGGTGLTGREALKGLIKDPALELVGVLVTSPDKLGKDAGALVGMPDTGIVATDDVDAILALKPDCFCYCGTAVGREEEGIEDMARLLAAGINVVTISTIPMIYAPAAPPAWRERIAQACQQGGSSFYASGSEPGAISLNLPAALFSGAGEVDEYRMDLYALTLDVSYPVWEVLHESMGFAKPADYVPTRISSGKVELDWIVVVRYLADILGFELDDIEVDWETLTAPRDLETAMERTIPVGTISGHRWRLSGKIAGKPVVSVQYFATVSSTPWPEHWGKPASGMMLRMIGNPSVELLVRFDPNPEDKGKMSPLGFTAMAVVNAIPKVVEAPPGIVVDPITGRGAVSRISPRARYNAG